MDDEISSVAIILEKETIKETIKGTIFICTQIAQITQIFLLVNNYQKLFKNFICTQIAQITQIFCWSKITKNYSKILFVHRLNRFFYLYTDYTDNTDFCCWSTIINNHSTILFVHRLH